MKHLAKYPYVVVRDPEGGRTKYHEDRFFDDLTRDPERRTPWRSADDKPERER